MAEMNDLIAKLEAAREGSRELDRAIARSMGFTTCTGSGLASALGGSIYKSGDASQIFPLPYYTTSITAALTILMEGWHMTVSQGDRSWVVEFTRQDPQNDISRRPSVGGLGATFAIAACIAVLKTKLVMLIANNQGVAQPG